MFEKLAFIEERYEELTKSISDVSVMEDRTEWSKLCKELADITPIVEKYREYKKYKESIEESKMILEDASAKDLHELAKMELDESLDAASLCEEELKILMLPKDPNDDKNVIM